MSILEKPIFGHIPQFTASPNYPVTVRFSYIKATLEGYQEPYGLDLDPDFQRGHVWTEDQQIKFVEFMFRGGRTGREILFNQSSFAGRGDGGTEPMVLVDGKQRLTAMLRFMNNEIKAFGYLYEEFEDRLNNLPNIGSFTFSVNTLKTRAEVLQWYLDLNSGGTPHSMSELSRVADLLRKETDTLKANQHGMRP